MDSNNKTPNLDLSDFDNIQTSIEVPDKSTKINAKKNLSKSNGPDDIIAEITDMLMMIKNTPAEDLINHPVVEADDEVVGTILEAMGMPAMTYSELISILKDELNNLTDDQVKQIGDHLVNGIPTGNSKANTDDKLSLDDSTLLKSNDFGIVPFIKDPDIYKKFQQKYGTDKSKYLDDTSGLSSFYVNDITAKLNLSSKNYKDLAYALSNDRYILFYATPNDIYTYGFFVAVTEDSNGNFNAFIPVFGNTFKYDKKSGEVSLYNAGKDPNMFTTSDDGFSLFKYADGDKKEEFYDRLDFACRFMMAPDNMTKLSPTKFGHITTKIGEVVSDGNYLPIGTIIPNDIPEAFLFEKENDLESNQNYTLYIRFTGRTKDYEAINAIGNALKDCDFNNNLLVKNSELEADLRGRLYFTVDLGEF